MHEFPISYSHTEYFLFPKVQLHVYKVKVQLHVYKVKVQLHVYKVKVQLHVYKVKSVRDADNRQSISNPE